MPNNIVVLPDIEEVRNTDNYQRLLDMFNLAAAKINQLQSGLVSLEKVIGLPLENIELDNISDLIDAINKNLEQTNLQNSHIGDIQNLTTTEKNNLVIAINWLHTQFGDLNNLTTTDKQSLVASINWLHSELNTINTTKSTETEYGLIKNSTQAEADDGTLDDNYSISPLKLKSLTADSNTAEGLGDALKNTASNAANVTTKGFVRLATSAEINSATEDQAVLTPLALSMIQSQSALSNSLAQAILQSIGNDDTKDVYWDTTKPKPILMVRVDGNYVAVGSDYVNTGAIQNTDAFTAGAQATETDFGVSKIATQNDVNSGTLDTKIVTPAKLKNLSHNSDTALGIVKALFGDVFGLVADQDSLKFTVDKNLDGNVDSEPAFEIFRNGDVQSYGKTVWKSLPNEMVVGLNAEKVGGKAASYFVPTIRQVAAGDGLTGGGSLANNITLDVDYATKQEAEDATSETKVMSPKRVAEYFTENAGKDTVQFFGLKYNNGNLILDKGKDTFNSDDYFWWDLLPLTTVIRINVKGQLVIEL